eukprot:Skav216770  [mRNA]  locus=scaffold3378:31329:36554:- [translate_table: standard]
MHSISLAFAAALNIYRHILHLDWNLFLSPPKILFLSAFLRLNISFGAKCAQELTFLRADHNNVQKELQELKERNQKVSSAEQCRAVQSSAELQSGTCGTAWRCTWSTWSSCPLFLSSTFPWHFVSESFPLLFVLIDLLRREYKLCKGARLARADIPKGGRTVLVMPSVNGPAGQHDGDVACVGCDAMVPLFRTRKIKVLLKETWSEVDSLTADAATLSAMFRQQAQYKEKELQKKETLYQRTVDARRDILESGETLWHAVGTAEAQYQRSLIASAEPKTGLAARQRGFSRRKRGETAAVQAGADYERLQRAGVSAVCAVGAKTGTAPGVVYHHVPVEDLDSTFYLHNVMPAESETKTNLFLTSPANLQDDGVSSMLPFLDSACAFVHEQHQQGAVLVHCKGGISRSPCLVVAYVMKFEQLTLHEALELCSLARPAAAQRISAAIWRRRGNAREGLQRALSISSLCGVQNVQISLRNLRIKVHHVQ